MGGNSGAVDVNNVDIKKIDALKEAGQIFANLLNFYASSPLNTDYEFSLGMVPFNHNISENLRY